ncbi:MAG: phosphate ABC transporter ATP-binding protein [Thermoflavifilum sp.]|nr:phosphate ABC transporter ATP-binding protein [Thermoflavifilum sp.]MCL6514122.1 phosphate ABC transporter ATP-binding protein [Alicyclobacillus sp.]
MAPAVWFDYRRCVTTGESTEAKEHGGSIRQSWSAGQARWLGALREAIHVQPPSPDSRGAAIRFDHAGAAVLAGEGNHDKVRNGEEGGSLRWLLRDVNGRVEPGQCVAIIGPSGSGKSTLLSLCNLLRTPSAGHVFVDEVEVRAWRPSELRRRVAMVFQQPVMLPGTVRDNIEAAPRLHGLPLPDARELLERVGLFASMAEQPADGLSGGQRQRVALARALAQRPAALLLDEVTSALDADGVRTVEAAILAWRRETGGTVMWVTHDLVQARRVSHVTWVVLEGRIAAQGETEKVFASPPSEAVRAFLAGAQRPGQGEDTP